MPNSGAEQHPIELSSDTTSYHGSPYHGPDEWNMYFNKYTFYNTPEHNSLHTYNHLLMQHLILCRMMP
ncbi:hypothetical protein HanXRQr2_Chr14g0659521 [Helianthus annuus]|uniref:Uncharacterized protein n=1 Tax=Helianthus annuus TaxID=4232 RepID=A0A9K3EAW1_HELAN|nr:hypothetical protein HanXRQr2_Chr14g0659521 [Helianthus annuus]KAJ0470133.1 hypothetical protein HanIR_Chr14g0715481 [Helianthus annuus]KAJ0841628.1 hypothetical protein HanPSC8_Chr14g0632591 [Helianthus annuus]